MHTRQPENRKLFNTFTEFQKDTEDKLRIFNRINLHRMYARNRQTFIITMCIFNKAVKTIGPIKL